MCSKALDKKILKRLTARHLATTHEFFDAADHYLDTNCFPACIQHTSPRDTLPGRLRPYKKSSDMRLEAQHVQNSFSWRAPISTSNAQRLLSCKSGRTTQIIGGIRARCACRIKRCVLQREWQMHAQTKRYARCNKHDNRSLTTHGYTLLLCSCVF